MNISFDFDGCLSREDVQEICRNHIAEGHAVSIITSRWENPNNGNNNDLLTVAEHLGVKKIIYTHHKPKKEFLSGIDIHYDDNPYELEDLSDTKGVLIK